MCVTIIQEDTTARGIIQLKGATVQEKKGSSGEFIIAIIRINRLERNLLENCRWGLGKYLLLKHKHQ